jgi:leader peptidase (prepilin peptidase)/N-methyltransferase
MAGSWLFFFVVWFVNPRGLGFGDVRLAALNGLMTGYVGIGNAVLAIMLGLLFGAVAGISLMALRKKGRREAIPFGPFLALGAYVAVMGPLAFG